LLSKFRHWKICTMKTSTNFKLTVYTSESGLRSPAKLLKELFYDLFSHQSRDLAWRLLVRNISGMYRQSLLGIMWIFIPPIISSIIWIFLNSQNVVQISETNIPYSVFVLTGNLLWQGLTLALSAPINAVQKEKAMLTKINMPREPLLVAGFGETLVNIFIPMILLLPIFIWYKIPVSKFMLLAPLGLFSVVFFGFTMGLVLTPIGLLFQDIGRAIPILARFWFFITPVVYPVPEEGLALIVMKFNPATPFIATSREWLTGQSATMFLEFSYVSGVMFLFLTISLIFYRLSMPHIIERMSA